MLLFFFCSTFIGQVGCMLVHVSLLFLSAFGTVVPLLLSTPCQYTTNSGEQTPLDADDSLLKWQPKLKYPEGHPLTTYCVT